MRSSSRTRLPIADLASPSFGNQLDTNNRELGFTAVDKAGGLKSPKTGRTLEGIKGELYRDAARFADELDEEKRLEYQDPTGTNQRGYSPTDVEKASSLYELRSSVMFARQTPAGHPREQYRPLFHRPNIPIVEIPTFHTNAEDLADTLDVLTLHAFEELAVERDMWWGEIASLMVDAESFVRVHIYPAAEVVDSRILNGVETITGEVVDGVEVVDIIYGGRRINNVVRAGPHPDTGFYTWLVGSEDPGLYIQLPDGEFMPFTARRDMVVGNPADFAAKVIPGSRSVIHGVGLTPETAQRRRLSIANFTYTRPRTRIGGDFTAVWLYQRLHEINLIESEGLRDELIRKVKDELITDGRLISETLLWCKSRTDQGFNAGSHMPRYFHLVNTKTGRYERIEDRPDPLIQIAA